MSKPSSSRRKPQSFLSRNPWLTAPIDWFDALLTPRHWPRIADAGADTLAKVTSPDSTVLGAALAPFTGVVGASNSTNTQDFAGHYSRLDWRVRKFVWSSVWTGTVLFRYRPKQASVPRSKSRS